MSHPRLPAVVVAAMFVLLPLLILLPSPVRAAPDLSKPFVEFPATDPAWPSTVSVSDDGSMVATAMSYNGNVTVYSMPAQATLWSTTVASGIGADVAVTGDGTKVVSCDSSGTVRMFSVGGGNHSLWSYSMGKAAVNIATNHNGSVTVVGATGSAFLFNQSGYVKNYTSGNNLPIQVAMSSDGTVIRGISGKNIIVFGPDFSYANPESFGGDLGSAWQGGKGLAISNDGNTIVASYIDDTSDTRFAIIRMDTSHFYYPTFSGSYSRFCLSGDGRTLFFANSEGLFMYDTLTQNLIWNETIMYEPWALAISKNGGSAVASFTETNLVRFYGRVSSTPVDDMTLDQPYLAAFSGDGSTLAISGKSLTVFRPSISIELEAPGSMILPHPLEIMVRATVDGEPLLGATVEASVNGTAINCSVTEKGAGYYEVKTTEGYQGIASYVPVHISVSKQGLGSASSTVTTLVTYQDDPSYPIAPDYSGQLSDLRSQVAGLQGVVLLVAAVLVVTMAVLVLYVWRYRRS